MTECIERKALTPEFTSGLHENMMNEIYRKCLERKFILLPHKGWTVRLA